MTGLVHPVDVHKLMSLSCDHYKRRQNRPAAVGAVCGAHVRPSGPAVHGGYQAAPNHYGDDSSTRAHPSLRLMWAEANPTPQKFVCMLESFEPAAGLMLRALTGDISISCDLRREL